MDRIEKALQKLSARERRRVHTILTQLAQGTVEHLQIQKLHGHDDIFRVRKGDLRIIYRRTDTGIMILAIERRSTNTYREW